MKIIDLIIDEDNLIRYEEYVDLNEYVDNVKDIISCFSESNIVNIDDVESYLNDGYLKDDDNNINEKMKLIGCLVNIKKLLKDNENYVLVEYNVEYDNSFLLIDKNDYVKLFEMGNV